MIDAFNHDAPSTRGPEREESETPDERHFDEPGDSEYFECFEPRTLAQLRDLQGLRDQSERVKRDGKEGA